MKMKTINVLVATLFTAGALVACGGNTGSPAMDAGGQAPKLLAQTSSSGMTTTGYNSASTSIQFYVNGAAWADIHYTVNGGGQINARMTVASSNNTFTVQNLKAGDVVRHSFTYASGVGAVDSAWFTASPSGTTTTTPTPTPTPTPSPTGWTLAWADEFNGTALDGSKWNIELNGNGGGNNELQYYTARPENVRVTGGNLVLEARREAYMGKGYTSGRITTQNKHSWQYGRMEARMKIPTGPGTWPAFWMLGNAIATAGWPAGGEIDIMEHVNNESWVHGTIHWSNQNNTYSNYGGKSGNLDFSQFHVYAAEWDSSAIRYYVNGVKYHEVSIAGGVNGTSEFHAPYFLLFNLAVGGNWPGNPDASTVFPHQMQVDYVRVFRK